MTAISLGVSQGHKAYAQRQERKELRHRVWANNVLKPPCAVLEHLLVRFFDQVPGVEVIESFGIESKLAPSFRNQFSS